MQAEFKYDVFLSFHSQDRAAVCKIAGYLKNQVKLRPWFDQWELIPGEDWLDGLERGLRESATCAVFIGRNGEGPWQRQEVKALLINHAKNAQFRLIPVLLPEAPSQAELPSFLPAKMWVDFRDKGLNDDDALWRLECGIRGEAPGPGRPAGLDSASKTMTPGGQRPATEILAVSDRARPPDLYVTPVAQASDEIHPMMIRIPAGPFYLGNQEDESEKPFHQVELPEFFIGRYPITNREYRLFVEDTGIAPPFHWKGIDETETEIVDDHPILRVSWCDALAYCQWLGRKTGEFYRLPTEAEWEKAAGWDWQTGCQRRYPWGDDWNKDLCNSKESGLGQTTPVGQYSPGGDSVYGVADLSGNVWEWCQSQFVSYPYQSDDGREDLQVVGDRVLRGGSFATPSKCVRCTFRLGCHPKTREHDFGFRIALSIPCSTVQ
jgi:formylglycine-generating enzyme required for sulfatase activity